MNAKQKRLLLPMAILALGLVALIGAAAFIVSGGGGEQARQHPTPRELDNLREFVLTQQWLQQQAIGDAPGGGAAAAAGGAAAGGGGGGTVQQLQAMQLLWEQGGRGG